MRGDFISFAQSCAHSLERESLLHIQTTGSSHWEGKSIMFGNYWPPLPGVRLLWGHAPTPCVHFLERGPHPSPVWPLRSL